MLLVSPQQFLTAYSDFKSFYKEKQGTLPLIKLSKYSAHLFIVPVAAREAQICWMLCIVGVTEAV